MERCPIPELLAQHQYALLDRVALHPEPWHKDLPTLPLVSEEFKRDADKMPELLPLDPKEPWFPVFSSSLEKMDEKGWRPIVSALLVVSEETRLESLVGHLTSRLVLHSPRARAILRYYDSNIFPHFQRILRPVQIQALYGPIEQFTFRFKKGPQEIEWITEPAPDITEPLPALWSVTMEQRAALERVGAVNQALDFWRAKNRSWANLTEFRKVAVHMDRMIAEELRKESEMDEEALAVYAAKSFQEMLLRNPKILSENSLN